MSKMYIDKIVFIIMVKIILAMLAFSPSLGANSWTWIEDFEDLNHWELASYSASDRRNVWWVENNHLHGQIYQRPLPTGPLPWPVSAGEPDFGQRILLFKGIPAKFTEFTISFTFVSREQAGVAYNRSPITGLLVGGIQSCTHAGEELLEKFGKRNHGFSCDLLEPEERPFMFYLFDVFFIQFRAFSHFAFGNAMHKSSFTEPYTEIRETKQMEIHFKQGHFQLFSNQMLVYEFTDPDFEFVNQIGFFMRWERTSIEIANLRMSGREVDSVAVDYQGNLASTWAEVKQGK
ncbi:hypothetical protein IH992_27155 [Candidatus Poribacteria bacterium]|nr:hypothetical protein [Candidatus Poribacteria bacterium]